MNPREPDQESPTLYLTVSYYVRNLETLFSPSGPGFSAQFKRFISTYSGTKNTIGNAIYPMFDDIAHRERQIFGKDIILDTGTTENPNSQETVVLHIDKSIEWHTEGKNFTADLTGSDWTQNQTQFDFKGVRFQYFWCIHSDTSLSYHISIKVPYHNGFSDYFALAAIQKAFFPSEELKEDGRSFKDRVTVQPASDLESYTVEEFIFQRFKAHAQKLHNEFTKKPDTKLIANMQRSVIFNDDAHWNIHKLRKYHCQAIFLLKDPLLFKALKMRDNRSDKHTKLQTDGTLSQVTGYEQKITAVLDGVKFSENAATTVYKKQDNEALDADGLAHVFASGFFQNVIDFFRQNASEVSDGLDPIYSDEDFLLYVNRDAVFEVVQESRSLDAAQRFVGTCPYILLVHLMTFHDEALIKHFEDEVTAVIAKFHKEYPDDFSPAALDLADVGSLELIENSFHQFRKRSFETVDKYLSFNFLRYDTERSFFTSIEEHRGIKQRREYWDEVVDRLGDAVGGIREMLQRNQERSFNRYLFAIAVFNVVQVLFAASAALHTMLKEDARIKKTTDIFDEISLLLTAVGVLWFFIILWSRRKFIAKRLFSRLGTKKKGLDREMSN